MALIKTKGVESNLCRKWKTGDILLTPTDENELMFITFNKL